MYKSHKSIWSKSVLFSLFSIAAFTISPLPSSKAETLFPSSSIQEIKNKVVEPVVVNQIFPQTADQQIVGDQLESQTELAFASSLGFALKIDAIHLNIPLLKTTLDKNRALMVPANPNQAAWYKNGPKPGSAGTALITGHLDSALGPAVFYNLKQLKAGQKISVRRDDGKVATFKVDRLASYPQNASFPWSQVYNTSGPSSLRLITCDGVYSRRSGHYSRNLVVYASLVSLN